MRYKETRYSIQIIPETPQDEAFLETVFNLRKKGDTAIVIRVSPMGVEHAWAFAEVRAKEE